MGTEGRLGSHAGSRMATQPAQIISTRSRVRDHDDLRWGLGGASLMDNVPKDFQWSMQDPLQRGYQAKDPSLGFSDS
jgi:hypothetical protein